MLAAFGAVLTALVLAGSALATPLFGVAEDAMKYANDGGGPLYDKLLAAGMVEDRVTVPWNPDDPTTIQEQGMIDRTVPIAQAKGVKLVFSVYPNRAGGLAGDANGALFVGYLVQLAQRYPSVKEFIVGNEPNERYFWTPQFGPDGAQASGALYEHVLANAYDALKAVNPAIVVVGMGLSPDANDLTSTSPVRFLKAVGDAYRASGRQAPLMDQLGFHIYPKYNVDQPTTHYAWPNAGAADLDRIKQSVWDAFNGTAQPVFQEAGQAGGRYLTFKLDEVGWQASLVPGHTAGYFDQENVTTVSESTQAQIYADLVRSFSCDPTVADVLFFHLIDEPSLKGLQSGLLRLDGSERPAYPIVRAAIVGAGSCASPHDWSHAYGVVGANLSVDLSPRPADQAEFVLGARADEGAMGAAGIFRVANRQSRPTTSAAGRGLSGGSGLQPVVAAAGPLKVGATTRYVFEGRLQPGWYVYAIRIAAEMNPARTSTLVSPAFRVG